MAEEKKKKVPRNLQAATITLLQGELQTFKTREVELQRRLSLTEIELENMGRLMASVQRSRIFLDSLVREMMTMAQEGVPPSYEFIRDALNKDPIYTPVKVPDKKGDSNGTDGDKKD